MIGFENDRNGTGTKSPTRVSPQKCARIAGNCISPALSIANATEMRPCIVSEPVFSRNANGMRESLFRVAFPVRTVPEKVKTHLADTFFAAPGRKRIGCGPGALKDFAGGKPRGTPNRCATWTEVAGRHEPLASRSIEWRYDLRGTIYAHIVSPQYTVTYKNMRSKVATYAHA